jgi:hypothetical protein
MQERKSPSAGRVTIRPSANTGAHCHGHLAKGHLCRATEDPHVLGRTTANSAQRPARSISFRAIRSKKLIPAQTTSSNVLACGPRGNRAKLGIEPPKRRKPSWLGSTLAFKITPRNHCRTPHLAAYSGKSNLSTIRHPDAAEPAARTSLRNALNAVRSVPG